MNAFRVAVIIPAAGRSSRFGGVDKLAQDVGGRPSGGKRFVMRSLKCQPIARILLFTTGRGRWQVKS
jgi:CTP:molybdopterin cytidylyltransferase MocA